MKEYNLIRNEEDCAAVNAFHRQHCGGEDFIDWNDGQPLYTNDRTPLERGRFQGREHGWDVCPNRWGFEFCHSSNEKVEGTGPHFFSMTENFYNPDSFDPQGLANRDAAESYWI